MLVISAVFGLVGCSSISVTATPPSKYNGVELCDRFRSFLSSKLLITDAYADSPIGTEEGGIVGWSTSCNGRHTGGKLIGVLQVHNPRTAEPLEVPSYLLPLAGFEGKAWTGAPLPYWTEIYVQDGTWSAAMRFVKDSPHQELLEADDVQAAAEFLVQVAHDLQD
ncbi:hypothetical protein Ntsu_33670 [Nocardia sp. IFM 10818]